MIPVASTRISVLRFAIDDDPTDPKTEPTVVVENVRAVISMGRRSETASGSQEVSYYRLTCDVCDLRSDDVLVDLSTELPYTVIAPSVAQGIGPVTPYIHAEMRRVYGVESKVRFVIR